MQHDHFRPQVQPHTSRMALAAFCFLFVPFAFNAVVIALSLVTSSDMESAGRPIMRFVFPAYFCGNVLLGIVAYSRVARSGGQLRGGLFALIGVVVSLMIAIVWILLLVTNWGAFLG